MPGYTTTQISATSLTSLATYVNTLGPVPTTGPTIYALNCAVCHGANAQGTSIAPYLAGVPVTTLSSVTRSGLGTIMPAYSTTDISNTNLTTLANYILTLGQPPSDGLGVYAEYCAVCHGTSGTGGSGGRIAGASVSTTTSIVRSGSGSMPGFTTTQISNTGLTNLANYVNSLGTTTTVPAAPASLSATAVSAGPVNLTWVDNATNETGYRLERSTSSAFSTITSFTLAAGATSYSDTTVSVSTTYYYRVFATASVTTSSSSTQTSPTVATNAASYVTTSSARLNGNLSSLGSASSVTVSFEWGTSSSAPFSSQTATLTRTSTGFFYINISGLASNTTYYFRVKAVGGDTSYGTVLSFRTSGG